MPGRVFNYTGEPIAVYGPNDGFSSTYDNKRYLLPNGRETPVGWDCDGVFIPNDRTARRLIFENRAGPVAVKYIDWQKFVVIVRQERGGTTAYQMPLDFGTWGAAESHCPTDPHLPGLPPARICWEIPDESSGDLLGLPEVPGHLPARCPWFLPFIGLERIDALLAGDPAAQPITRNDPAPDVAAVEVVQELLRGHDLRKVPGRKLWKASAQTETFGIFGARTEKAVVHFKKKHATKWGFAPPLTPDVDTAMLRALLLEPSTTPGAGRAYLMAILNRPYSIWEKMVSLISTHEEHPKKGGFAAQTSPGADAAGLSYGLLQWTHRSTRLATLLQQFRSAAPQTFKRCFQVSGTTLDGLIQHAAAGDARLNADGSTRVEYLSYDLFSARWRARFHTAGLDTELQRLQVRLAVEDIQAEYRFLKDPTGGSGAGYATLLNSQWAVGFWIDLANQMGRTGARNRYLAVVNGLGGNPTEQQILDSVVSESSYKDRREYYRDAAPLSKTEPFPTPS